MRNWILYTLGGLLGLCIGFGAESDNVHRMLQASNQRPQPDVAEETDRTGNYVHAMFYRSKYKANDIVCMDVYSDNNHQLYFLLIFHPFVGSIADGNHGSVMVPITSPGWYEEAVNEYHRQSETGWLNTEMLK